MRRAMAASGLATGSHGRSRTGSQSARPQRAQKLSISLRTEKSCSFVEEVTCSFQ